MTLTVKQFVDKLWPHCLVAAQLLEVAPKYAAVFVVQLAHESGFEADQWVGHNNYAGITNDGPPNFRKYTTIDEFISDYVDVFRYTYKGTAYKAVLNDMRSNRSIEDVLITLGQSAWDAGHYGRNYGLADGELLLRRWREIEPHLPSGWDVPRGTPTVTFAFADVPADHWAKDLWKEALDRGIVRGNNEGLLRPNAECTRSEALVMALNAAKYTFERIKELTQNGGSGN